MGIGDPVGILEVVARGVDMFDCVLPTRTARTGLGAHVERPPQPAQRALTRAIRGRSRRTARCPACSPLLARLHPSPRDAGARSSGSACLSLHNLWFVLDLTARARAAIERGAFSAFRRDALARLAQASEEEP